MWLGAHDSDGGNFEMTNNRVFGNSAFGHGSAYLLRPTGGRLAIDHETIYGNENLGNKTSAVYLGGNCNASNTSFANSIIWANVRRLPAPAPLVIASLKTVIPSGSTSPGPPLVVHNDIEVDPLFQNGGVYPGAGNICARPKFVDAFSANFQLDAGSPCVDAGNDAFINLDLLGNLDKDSGTWEEKVMMDFRRSASIGRSRFAATDMGAFEQ